MSFQIKNQRTGQVETLTVKDILNVIGNSVDDEVRIGEKVYTISSFSESPNSGTTEAVLFVHHAYRPTAQTPLGLLALQFVPKWGLVQVFKNGVKLFPDQYYVNAAAGTVRLANNLASSLDPATDVIDLHYSHSGVVPPAPPTGANARYNYGALNPDGTYGNTGNNTGNGSGGTQAPNNGAGAATGPGGLSGNTGGNSGGNSGNSGGNSGNSGGTQTNNNPTS